MMAITWLTLLCAGCTSVFDKHVEWETIKPEQFPTLSAVGYAPINAQKGDSETTRMLLAIKASKLEAYRELAEQVYGQRIDGKQSLQQLVLADTQLKSSVEGVIRGARVVKSYAVGEDMYATEMTLDFQDVYDIYLSTARPKKVKDVSYY
ncbi:LPP20 family lipoprotein [Alteromonas oceanisediminis]|uniref:LPP20 family lipoprotein n=1 Tax=Alteromonas oceanisediminis TaxID=2836180 RepID=UPI001BDA9BAB|nr:LPP20 family lipoprotein [Alteromonas oceanisediminis]MBT0584974.1 LPP20 family lipoprotein [Alteromonas oceanisediminis]